MYQTRPMVEADIPAVITASRVIHELSVFAGMDFSNEKCTRLLRAALARPEALFAHVILHKDDLVGLLLGVVQESYFGVDKVAHDLVLFVLPRHQGRCARALMEMLDVYKAWASERGAKILQFGVSTQIEAQRTAEVFGRLGFPQTGSLHAITLH